MSSTEITRVLDQTPIPTREELLASAVEWIPTLRDRSAETEELRHIPQQTFDEFIARQFHLVAQPKRFGGFDLGVDMAAELSLEVGRGCCSTAWMVGQWPGHQFMVSMFSEQAQQEYWGSSPNGINTMSSTASAIVANDYHPEGDGLRLVDVRRRFSSGCDYAEWILLMTPTHMCLVPKSDFTIIDDWHVSGLRGTGSKQISIQDAFVPPHRMFETPRIANGTTPGSEIYPDNPYLHAPISLALNTLLLGPTVGMARGLIDLFEERALTRVDGHTGQKAFERPGTQLRFAESTAEVDCAILLLKSVLNDLVEWGSQDRGPMPVAGRARLRRNVCYTAKLCMQAADRLLEAGDASGMFNQQLWQRWGRDIHMAGLQMVLTWDEPALAYSQARWGLTPSSFLT